jgi:hypothetical protein
MRLVSLSTVVLLSALVSGCSQGSGDDSAPTGAGTGNADFIGNGAEHSTCYFINSDHGCGPGLTCRDVAPQDTTPRCEKPLADGSDCAADSNCASQFCWVNKCTAVTPMGFGWPCSDRWKDCTTDPTHLLCRNVGWLPAPLSDKRCVPDEPTCSDSAASGIPCCHSDSDCHSQYCKSSPTADEDFCVGPPAQSSGQGASCHVLTGSWTRDKGMFCQTFGGLLGGSTASMCEPLLKQNQYGCGSDSDCDQSGPLLKCSGGTCVLNQ